MNATTNATAKPKTVLLRKLTMSEIAQLPRKSGGFKPVRDFGAKVDPETGIVQPFEPVLIGRIVGVVRSAKQESTDFGVYTEFTGNFGATSGKGVHFRAPKCILPEPAQSLLADALAAADGNAVELAFDFHALPDAGDRGYRFQVTPLMEQPEDDPIARLSNQVQEQFALPSPTADTPEPKEDAPAPKVKADKQK